MQTDSPAAGPKPRLQRLAEALMVLALLILWFFPQIVTTLPNKM